MKLKTEIQMKNEAQKKINTILENLDNELYSNDLYIDMFLQLSENKKKIYICLK